MVVVTRDLHLLCLNDSSHPAQCSLSPSDPGGGRGLAACRSRQGPMVAAKLWEPCPLRFSPKAGAIQAPALCIRAAVPPPAPTALPLPPRWAQAPLRPHSPAGRDRALGVRAKAPLGLCFPAPLSERPLVRLRRREQPPGPAGAAPPPAL